MKRNGHIYKEGDIRLGPTMATTHSESEQREISERYVRGKLAPQERLAFEEHFFVCDECFQHVQMMERFTAGMRHAAETGRLAPQLVKARLPLLQAPWKNWLSLGFATTAIATLILTASLSWLMFYQVPRMRGELAQARQAREQTEIESRQQLQIVAQLLEAERQQRARLETQLEQEMRARSERQPGSQQRVSDAEDQVAMVTAPQPNVPVAVLQATRGNDSDDTELAVPNKSRSVVLWVEVESSRFQNFRVQIYSANSRLVQTIAGLKRNKEGALSVSLPAKSLSPGKYIVKLYGVSPNEVELVGSYRLNIVRPQTN